jgi:hypothetical protein
MPVNKKTVLIALYAMFCASVMFFIFASLGIYEENFSDINGAWYSKESMALYQYAAYSFTYIISFPSGTALGYFNNSYISEKWYVFCVPDFIIYYYIAIKIKTMLTSNRSVGIKE